MPPRPRRASKPNPVETRPVLAVVVDAVPQPIPRRTLVLIVAFLLVGHYGLAAYSLVRENPTVDEVNHLPAGVSYWQTGSFRLYHHNPPLIKMIAALPLLGDVGEFRSVYQAPVWQTYSFSAARFGAAFSQLFAAKYFEFYARSRLMMPLFSVLGGVFVFAWSRRLFGDRGGLLSLALWCLCPNILAHARLITSDVGAAALGFVATYGFWRYLHKPTWNRAVFAGLLLGLAQLSKFSMLLLYLIWPMLAIPFVISGAWGIAALQIIKNAIGHGLLIVCVSVLMINIGYGFEGTGRPLGDFRFASHSFLTKPGRTEGQSGNWLIDLAWQHRVNRFKGTWLGRIPAPLPKHYLLGFDEQKLEADGFPRNWVDRTATDPTEMSGYTVYLDGVLRRTGWRSYYVRSWLYKTPEGTIMIVAAALLVFFATKRGRVQRRDEAFVSLIPVIFFGAMTFLTDINIGLRYVLPVYPYLFVFVGRLGLWADLLPIKRRRIAWGLIVLAASLTMASTLSVHPHYLTHFNTVSGGPDREPPRLIDSNLDWGQDLIGLRDWMKTHPTEGPVGLVYFGQIPPQVFDRRGEGFPWFLPPGRPGRLVPLADPKAEIKKSARLANLVGPTEEVTPGLYAVSATMRAGLSWRVYDPSLRVWGGVWRAEDGAYDYFRVAKPFARIGHSILLFRLSPKDASRLEAERLRPIT